MQVFYQIISAYFEDDCADELMGDLLKAELRDGTMYCSNEADFFMKSLLDEFISDFPDMPLYLHGDSGFASLDLYEVLEDKNCKYAIRLKENAKHRELAEVYLYCHNAGNETVSGNSVLLWQGQDGKFH